MAKEHCLMGNKNSPTLRLHIMQLIAPISFLGITGHINFNIKILEILAMEIITKYSKEMKTGRILHAAGLSRG